MREDNLLCLRQRSFVVTTDSKHSFMVYPNLAGQLEPAGTDQLWVADITYIRLAEEFVYLAVILDAYSRAQGRSTAASYPMDKCPCSSLQVIGWSLERTLAASLTVAALRMALQCRRITPELVHHSDRGVQYASHEYTALLLEHGIRISMSRKANPYDNAQCESFMKTLKYEEVYRADYRDLSDAQVRIREFIEAIYNGKRLHSALKYVPPAEYERSLALAPRAAGVQPELSL